MRSGKRIQQGQFSLKVSRSRETGVAKEEVNCVGRNSRSVRKGKEWKGTVDANR